MKTVVVALGGNALLQQNQRGTINEQRTAVQNSVKQIVRLIQSDYHVIVTHGNGPQVGNILLQNEIASRMIPPMPLDVCGSESQGMLGYLIQQGLKNELHAVGLKIPVATILTQVIVDLHDPAFKNPTKPVGNFYTREVAEKNMKEKGETWIEDSGRGWRKVVPSPQPREIAEIDTIETLVKNNVITVAGGGGGIPVIKENNRLVGVEAVIDKDLASSLLARSLKADILAIITDVPYVALNYGKPDQQDLRTMPVGEAKKYLALGYFGRGSMEPKVRAAIEFVELERGEAVITSLENLEAGVKGLTGTRIVLDDTENLERKEVNGG